MNEKLKYLTKTVSGYAGLNFTDANYAAFLEAFEMKTDQQFINALNRAVMESPTFFPPLPLVMKCLMQNEMDEVRAEWQRKLEQSQIQAQGQKNVDYKPKSQGWLYNLFQQKCAERRARQ